MSNCLSNDHFLGLFLYISAIQFQFYSFIVAPVTVMRAMGTLLGHNFHCFKSVFFFVSMILLNNTFFVENNIDLEI